MGRMLIAAMALLAVCAGARAADKGFYVGAGRDHAYLATQDGGFPGFKLSGYDSGYTLVAGFRPLNAFAIEASYLDFGDLERRFPQTAQFPPDPNAIEAARYRARGVDVFAVGLTGWPLVEVFGKLGVVRWRSTATTDTSANRSVQHARGSDLAYGAGVAGHLGSIALRLQYEGFDLPTADQAAAWSLGFTWTF